MPREDIEIRLKHNHSWLIQIKRNCNLSIGRGSYRKQKPAPYKQVARALRCGDAAIVDSEDDAKKLATSIMHDGYAAKRGYCEKAKGYYVKKLQKLTQEQQELFK
jgi:hypothetical protein